MYTDRLQLVLKTEHRKSGFRLEEDEHFLYLYDREGRNIGIFSSCGATVTAIQGEVDVVMKK